MVRAMWNNTLVAESEQTIVVEGNHYFPAATVKSQFLRESDTTTYCGWKGTASYYHLVVEGQTNSDAAWFYPEPMEKARHIQGHIAFWKGVEIAGD